jgi:hypothetical protein
VLHVEQVAAELALGPRAMRAPSHLRGFSVVRGTVDPPVTRGNWEPSRARRIVRSVRVDTRPGMCPNTRRTVQSCATVPASLTPGLHLSSRVRAGRRAWPLAFHMTIPRVVFSGVRGGHEPHCGDKTIAPKAPYEDAFSRRRGGNPPRAFAAGRPSGQDWFRRHWRDGDVEGRGTVLVEQDVSVLAPSPGVAISPGELVGGSHAQPPPTCDGLSRTFHRHSGGTRSALPSSRMHGPGRR